MTYLRCLLNRCARSLPATDANLVGSIDSKPGSSSETFNEDKLRVVANINWLMMWQRDRHALAARVLSQSYFSISWIDADQGTDDVLDQEYLADCSG